MKNNVKERQEPLSTLALPQHKQAQPTVIEERVTTIPAPSGVFSGWGPKA